MLMSSSIIALFLFATTLGQGNRLDDRVVKRLDTSLIVTVDDTEVGKNITDFMVVHMQRIEKVLLIKQFSMVNANNTKTYEYAIYVPSPSFINEDDVVDSVQFFVKLYTLEAYFYRIDKAPQSKDVIIKGRVANAAIIFIVAALFVLVWGIITISSMRRKEQTV
ncbi:unnamed protein product [Bursaphelenchus okinawaensis]|uniref:Uncharacterized protein n=1 Tax=Bursaphelenchus okinawaensis TaxID=465554 RepID=A0A811KCQ7_9BILA|nr:unnamed protein product [Bursaphelenchus okinawaensis]CAG9097170.1 unnamed protein product [Bursaphelenchus okinawaensis]